MAIQVVPNNPSFGGSLGASLGSGLGQGLSMLAQNKITEIQNQKKAKAWEGIGLDPQTANFIVQQPESVQKEFISRLEGIGSPQGQQQGQQMMQGQPEQQAQQQGSSVVFGKSAAQKKEDAMKFKETKEFRREILEGKREARSTLKDLDRLEELSKSGKLDTPGYVSFLERSGLDIPALMSEESQEFSKIQQGFLKNAKKYFGGRVSNFEVSQFLKTVPSLSMTPSGRERVVANLKYIARGAEEYYKAYEEVLRENGGIPPYDVEELVERKSEKRLDRIYDQFKKEVNKPITKGQNRFITGLQAGAGSLVKPLAGALGGAAIGSVVPGVGTALGALGGAGGALGASLSGLI